MSPTSDADATRIDAHVHLMPPRLLAAVRESLSRSSEWAFDHPTEREAMEADLRSAGIERYVALPYAHEAGMADELNEWVLDAAADSEMAVPFATVHGDDDAAAVVRRAFEAGARGLKIQCPVQRSAPDDPRLAPAFELAAEYDRPVLFHAGTAPMFEESPHVGADRFARFVESFPEVRACAAHMGAYEVEAFLDLARRHEQVFLDTTMALSPRSAEVIGFDPSTVSDATLAALSESIMFGTDYPNLPYPYDEERRGLRERDLPDAAVRDVFGRTAERFLGERE